MQIGTADRGGVDFDDGIAGLLDPGVGNIGPRLISGPAVDKGFHWYSLL
jgi:hypothetical protein